LAAGGDDIFNDKDSAIGHICSFGELGRSIFLCLFSDEGRGDAREDRERGCHGHPSEFQSRQHFYPWRNQFSSVNGNLNKEGWIPFKEVLVEVDIRGLARSKSEMAGQPTYLVHSARQSLMTHRRLWSTELHLNRLPAIRLAPLPAYWGTDSDDVARTGRLPVWPQ